MPARGALHALAAFQIGQVHGRTTFDAKHKKIIRLMPVLDKKRAWETGRHLRSRTAHWANFWLAQA